MRWSAAETIGWIIRREPLGLRQWTQDMGPKLKDAKMDLAAAIADGRVQAWGRPQPHALTELIPTDPFRIAGIPVVVDAHGEMTSLLPHRRYGGDTWHSVEFEAEEIKQAWPKPAPASAKNWMMEEAERSRANRVVGKRDDMVRRCMADTGCTKRQAEAAHRELPGTLRRGRGKPPKSSG